MLSDTERDPPNMSPQALTHSCQALTHVIPITSTVIPSEAEGSETVADSNSLVPRRSRTPPTSYRRRPVPRSPAGPHPDLITARPVRPNPPSALTTPTVILTAPAVILSEAKNLPAIIRPHLSPLDPKPDSHHIVLPA